MNHSLAPQSDPLPAAFDNELACKSSESKLFCHNLIASNQQLLQHLNNPDFNGDLFHYSGTISQAVVIDIAATLKQVLAVTEPTSSAKSRKVFSSFVEMVQNAVHYSPAVPGSNGEKNCLDCGQQKRRLFLFNLWQSGGRSASGHHSWQSGAVVGNES